MRALIRAAQAHSVPVICVMTLLLSGAAMVWPLLGVTVDMFYPRPARGVSGAEAFGILLAGLVPAVSISPLGIDERRSGRSRAFVLAALAGGLMLMPVVPFALWYLRVHTGHVGVTPAPLPFVGSLLIYSALGSLAVRHLGQVVGPLALMGLFVGIVVTQNYFGADSIGRVFSTGNVWQTQWPVAAAVVAVAMLANYRLRGTQTWRLIRTSS